MANNKFVEYQDPINSMGINTSRRGFLPKGRYYGFDGFDGSKLTSSADSLLKYTDDNNVPQTSAVVISSHGVVLFTDPESSDLTLAPADGQFQVVVLNYTWQNTPGGSSYTWGTLATTSEEPVDPNAVITTATQVPIGYFKFGSGGGAPQWVPYPKPLLAGAVFDDSMYAKLNATNLFTKTNTLGYQSLTDADLSPSPWRQGMFNIELSHEGNVVYLDLGNLSDPVHIDGFNIPDVQDGTVLHLLVHNAPLGSFLHPPGDVAPMLPTPDGGFYYQLGTYNTFTFVYTFGGWHCYSALYNSMEYMAQLFSRVGVNEEVIANHENRIAELENFRDWIDITPTSYGIIEFKYLQIAKMGDTVYLRGKLEMAPSSRPPLGLIISDDSDSLGVLTKSMVLPCGVWESTGTIVAHVKASPTDIRLNVLSLDGNQQMGTTTLTFSGSANDTLG